MQPNASLEPMLWAQIQTLAPTLRPSTLRNYRCAVRRFLLHLGPAFPDLQQLSQLRRDPHLIRWFASLWRPDSPSHAPLSTSTRRQHLICLRRLFDDLAADGHALGDDLIRRDDFPPLPRYLPRPLSPDDDQRLLLQLRSREELPYLALRLMRATGIRVGECIDLSADCLRPLAPTQWALHVPLGKLHSERLVPVDVEVRNIIARMLALSNSQRSDLPRTSTANRLLPHTPNHNGWYRILRLALKQAALSAGCTTPVKPHQLRHTFATEMLRLRVSLPALMQMMGHKDIRMTLRYTQITQQDLQREFYHARYQAIQPHRVPELSKSATAGAGLEGVRQTLESAGRALEMFRRAVEDGDQRRTLQRLGRRISAVRSELTHLRPAGK